MNCFVVGSSPYEEDCAQVGSDDYIEVAIKECKVFINQIRREFGEEPAETELKIKSFNHDFGTYYEVVCYYNKNNEESLRYALKCENDCPLKWDKEALLELRR